MRTESFKGALLPVLREKKIVSGIVLMLLISMLALAFCVSLAKADGAIYEADIEIYIRSDGTVDPPTAPIQRDGDVYTFTGNISGTATQWKAIVVQRNNIVIDGKGYTLRGAGAVVGFDIQGDNVTLKNTVITGFEWPAGITGFAAAIYSFGTSNNIITNNTIINSRGINLESVTGWAINGNIIANSSLAGIYTRVSQNIVINNNLIKNNKNAIILVDSSNNRIYHNNFINNTSPGFGGEDNNSGDDGYPSGGNYWSDYTGVDEKSGPNQDESGSDGIGDTPYYGVVVDRYPFMEPFGEVPTDEVPSGERKWSIIAGIVAIIVVIGIVAALYIRRRKPTEFRW